MFTKIKNAVARTRRQPLIVWVICAMLIAVGSVLKMFSVNIPLGSVLLSRISFDMIPIYIAAFAFGPFMGGLTGALIDIIGFFMAPTPGGYNPCYTVTLILAGIVAWCFYRLFAKLASKQIKIKSIGIDARCILSVLFTQVIIVWPLNTLWTVVFFGSQKTFLALLLARIPAQLFCIAAYGIVLTFVIPVLNKTALKKQDNGTRLP